jgi:protein-disulfide isomerase
MRSALVAAMALTLVACASASGANAPTGGPQVASLFRGIPQHGIELGRRSAPVTLVEFVDLQCPFCARWERGALPEIVRKYVRPGKVRMVFAGVAFLGPGSVTGFRTALAAGLQNRLWNVVELMYINQGRENSGWITDAFLHRIGALVPGLDVRRMLANRRSAAVERQRAAASSLAEAAGINRTPSFAVGLTNKSLRPFEVTSLTAAAIEPTLDALLRG